MGVRFPMWRYWLPLLAALLLAFSACDGGGGGNDSVSDPREQLPRMVLTTDDLPEGYVQDEPSFSTNDDLALGDEEKLAKLEEQGRILGYSAPFTRGDVAATEAPYFGVESTASLYEAEAGASDSFAEAVEEARATDWEAILGFGEMQTEELDLSIADEALWLRITGVVESGEGQTAVIVIDDQILIRQGRARGFLRVSSALEGSSDRSALIDEVKALAEEQAGRMDDVLH